MQFSCQQACSDKGVKRKNLVLSIDDKCLLTGNTAPLMLINDLEISEKYVIKRLFVEQQRWQKHARYVGRALSSAKPSVIPTKPLRRSGPQTSKELRPKRLQVCGTSGSVRDVFVLGR